LGGIEVANKTFGNFRGGAAGKRRVGTAPEGLVRGGRVGKRGGGKGRGGEGRMSETVYNRFGGMGVGSGGGLGAGGLGAGGEFKVTHQNFLKTLGVNDRHIPEGLKSTGMEERGYEKMMDQHALHVFMIRNGKIIQETPEFLSFKRVIDRDLNRIVPFLLTIEQFAAFLEKKLIKVNGSELYKLIFQPKVSLKDIVACFIPPDDTESGYNLSDLIEELRSKAVLRIQRWIRMKLAQRTVLKIKILIQKAKIIQRRVKVYLFSKECKKMIIKQNAARKLLFDQLQATLKSQWPTIKTSRRVEIHYNNLPGEELKKLTMSKFDQKQNLQIGRIYRVIDPNVTLLYISTKEIPQEILKYYLKVLEINGIKNPHERVIFLSPENSEIFPDHFSTPGLIYYSPKLIRNIKDILKGRPAYIVSGQPCPDDIRLAVALGLPIVTGSPYNNCLYSKISNCYKLFEECNFPLPPSSVFLYKKEEVVPNLTKIIFENFHIERWVLKIENESNGRGIGNFFGFYLSEKPILTYRVAQRLPLRRKKPMIMRRMIFLWNCRGCLSRISRKSCGTPTPTCTSPTMTIWGSSPATAG
jgi:hypothetical protein